MRNPHVHRRVPQRSTVVTDLWQTSQISGLRILAVRIRRLTPRLRKSAGTSRCGHLRFSCPLVPQLPHASAAAHRIRDCFVIPDSSGPDGVARPSSPSLIAGVSAFVGYGGCLENVGRPPALSAGVRKGSAEDHHDELAGRAEMVFAGSIGRPMGG